MLTRKKIEVSIEKNEEVSTFYYRLKVADDLICAYDFDGIFCEECPSEYKGSDEAYYKFLYTAMPLYYPDKGYVPLIITGRHEKYREITDRWLKTNNILYGHMLMRNFEVNPHDCVEEIATYKAHAYKEHDYDLFIESRLKQARIINNKTDKPVYCPPAKVLITSYVDDVI